MPEIKLKHVISFSSEDKVHKAENLIKPETYRKWKCATPGEKNATVLLQFEKAYQIHSLDIGNDCSAFVEVLVGRSSDSVNDFQVLLVASSFMSPLDSRNEVHTNRVRMFGPEKLSQNVKDEKWDCVQIVCTQPFNKNITYGLSFIKFHSPSEKTPETPKSSEAESATAKLGAFTVSVSDDEESLLTVGSWFGKQKDKSSEDKPSSPLNKGSPSYADAVLASSNMNTSPPQKGVQKRKISNNNVVSDQPPSKKPPATNLDEKYIVYKPLDVSPGKKQANVNSPGTSKTPPVTNKRPENKKAPDLNMSKENVTSERKQANVNSPGTNKTPVSNQRNENKKAPDVNIPKANKKPAIPVMKKVPFNRLMEKVVFVLSGFVNPLRSDLRDKALEMGAKYKGDWDKSCTHLVCAFLNTPKYLQVRSQDGIIVKKEWILDCNRQKTLLPWRNYMLGSYTKDTSGEEESESEYESEEIETDESDEDVRPVKKVTRKKNTNIKTNGTRSPIKKAQMSDSKDNTSSKNPGIQFENSGPKQDSETDDEDAIKDYLADTDKDADSDSGGDTEDELRKYEMKLSKNTQKIGSPRKATKETEEELLEKPNVDDLPLPELPNLFKRKHFFLFGDFSGSKRHDMQRYITAYNGIIEEYMNNNINYVITEERWDQRFEEFLCNHRLRKYQIERQYPTENIQFSSHPCSDVVILCRAQALSENEDLIFIKPVWIYKCHGAGKLVPYQPFIVIPDS